MNLLSSAEAELAEIDRKLSELLPLTRRRDQLRAFIEMGRTLYGGAEPSYAQVPELKQQLVKRSEPNSSVRVSIAEALASPLRVTLAPDATSTAATKKARIAEAAAAILAKGRHQTRELVPLIEAAGVEIGTGNKADTLSVILSRDKRFNSDRAAGGWGLSGLEKEATPPVAPTTAGS